MWYRLNALILLAVTAYSYFVDKAISKDAVIISCWLTVICHILIEMLNNQTSENKKQKQ